ncbi:hypothetical protein F4818DRAFT_10887 [Hypoxylon cercidicola]|nr:hypothetical protein F4818DRAFT_10887 [Hypoxylon cercidicola]
MNQAHLGFFFSSFLLPYPFCFPIRQLGCTSGVADFGVPIDMGKKIAGIGSAMIFHFSFIRATEQYLLRFSCTGVLYDSNGKKNEIETDLYDWGERFMTRRIHFPTYAGGTQDKEK